MLTAQPNKPKRRIETGEDIHAPNRVASKIEKPKHAQEADKSFNEYILRQREAQGKRTLLRVNVEVYCRKSAKNMGFSRLRNRHLVISCPDSVQAELIIDTLLRVAQSLDGKMLTRL